MSAITLCMIVRDEAPVIKRCLASVRDLISYWVICDTGSQDGTQALIHQALAGIPGELHERPWISFGHNRTELVELAHGKGDYLLLLDADMTIVVDRAGLEDLSADAYMVRQSGPMELLGKWLVRADRKWRYIGSTHEHIATSGPQTVLTLDAIVVQHHADGASRVEKYERDLRLLEAEVATDPANPRATFYLAQTLADLDRPREAIDVYTRRAEMGGWHEEVFYSRFRIGALHAGIGNWAAAVPALIDAWTCRPRRIEPLYLLAEGYRLRGAHQAAYLFALRGLDRPQPDDALFVESWIYRWGLLFEYSIAAYYVGAVADARRACDRLLEIPELPEAYRVQTVRNRRFTLPPSRAGVELTSGDRRAIVSPPRSRPS